MKLFILAALIAVSYAGRLEHQEQQQQLRAYLPPSQRSFGTAPGAHGMSSGPSHPGLNAHATFPSASNQYLSPDLGASAGTSHGFEGQNSAQQFGHQAAPTQVDQQDAPTQFAHHDATPQGTNVFGSQARFQPHHTSEDIPEQSFDEQTGYHY